MLNASESRPLRVALLSSRRAPGVAELVGEARRTRSWRLVAGMASHRENELMQSLGALPVIVRDIAAFYAQRGVDRRDREVRRDYDRVTLELLSPYRPDVLVLCGYPYLVTDVLLAALPGRVINVHDSDLLRVDGQGVPLYRLRTWDRAGDR
ncbi:MAG TPA: formyltransferase family protein [Gemmatimonadaceae bacterium]|nr:formyltransferase family protein [Gemmatimonadaceae bacterium]